MKKLATLGLVAALCCSHFAKAQNKQSFFPKSDLMPIGVYYYPEQWPHKDWSRDLKRLGDLGFSFTHFAEFAWTYIEPQEGKFDFKWLDECVDLAHKSGLKVIMCTPSATPPIWLEEKHPEILMVNQNRIQVQHGSRQQGSWSSKVYREYVAKVVKAMADHYANDKRIWGWQLDNEPSHYGQFDYSDAAQKRFQEWLKDRYQTVDNLNTIWGNAFWSIRYDNFKQIRIPNQRELIAQPTPHAVLDFKRFSADEANDFLKMQYQILRKTVNASQWVTTNLMPEHTDVDPTKIVGSSDFLTYTKYPVAGYERGLGSQGFRLSSPSNIGFSNDLFRSFNGMSGVMELQPGQVNWGKLNPQPYPGAVRMWLWHAFAGGNNFVCTYRYRQPLTGGEQYHYGIVGTDGITPTTGGAEYIKVTNEMREMTKWYNPSAKMPQAYAKRQAAILYNADSRWELDNQPQSYQWSYMNNVKNYYNSLLQLNAPIDVIAEDKDFAKYPVLIAPAFQLLDRQLVVRWTEYVKNGGHLILSCRTAQKDRNGKLWEAKWADPIAELIGGKVAFYDMLPDYVQAKVDMKGASFNWNNWADVLEPNAGTNVWATYTDQYYSGKAAVTSRKLGKGTVTFVGPDSDDGELEKAVLKQVYAEAGVNTEDLPKGVVIQWRDGFWVAVNYGEKPYTLNIPASAKIRYGTKVLPTAGVTVWQE